MNKTELLGGCLQDTAAIAITRNKVKGLYL